MQFIVTSKLSKTVSGADQKYAMMYWKASASCVSSQPFFSKTQRLMAESSCHIVYSFVSVL